VAHHFDTIPGCVHMDHLPNQFYLLAVAVNKTNIFIDIRAHRLIDEAYRLPLFKKEIINL
jgi:hypothetical protein